MEKFYTVYEIADMFKVNRMTVYKWVETGKLKSNKIDTNVRISESDLKEFIDKTKSE